MGIFSWLYHISIPQIPEQGNREGLLVTRFEQWHPKESRPSRKDRRLEVKSLYFCMAATSCSCSWGFLSFFRVKTLIRVMTRTLRAGAKTISTASRAVWAEHSLLKVSMPVSLLSKKVT